VRLAVAVDPVPPSTDVIAPVVLTFVPAVVPFTLTINVQEPLAVNANPEMLILPPPAVALGVPAVDTPPPELRQVPLWPLGVATTSPAGRVSLKAMDCTLVDEFGFVMVKVRLVVAPIAIELVPNASARVGDGTALI
jgi:hypothetical protein